MTGSKYVAIAAGTIAGAGIAGHITGLTRPEGSKVTKQDLLHNMGIGALATGGASLAAALVLKPTPLTLLAGAVGAAAGAAYTLGTAYGASRHALQ